MRSGNTQNVHKASTFEKCLDVFAFLPCESGWTIGLDKRMCLRLEEVGESKDSDGDGPYHGQDDGTY